MQSGGMISRTVLSMEKRSLAVSRKSGDRPVGHLELKHTGYWYIVARTKDKFTSINTRKRDRAEAQKTLDVFLSEARRKIEERRGAIPLAKAWTQYENSPNSRRHDEKAKRKKRSAWLLVAEWMQVAHPDADEAAKITTAMANEYMNLYRKTHTASTCNNQLKLFSAMFDALLRDGTVQANPWRSVRRFPNDSRARRELEPAEVGRILAEARTAGGEWHSLMTTGLYTGLRLGDCCTLDWKDIDLSRMILQVIPRKTRKHSCGRPVTIPVHPQLLSMLERTPANARAGYVFPGMADMYLNHNSMLGDKIRGIFNAAGIETSVMIEGRTRPTPYATFHSLRHSFVSFAANSGVPLPVVQSIVGHRSSAMTRHYYHANETALRKAVDAVPDFEERRNRPAALPKPMHCTAATSARRPVRPLVERNVADAPLMRYWHIYAATAAARRLNAQAFANRRRAWRSFAGWMKERHPESDALADVTRRTGEEYLESLARTFANGTCNIYMLAVRDVFRTLVEELGGAFNPWDAVDCLPNDTVARRELSIEEISRLIEIAGTKGREWALLFRIAAYTGMRLGDCCRLEWKDVIMERDIIQIVPTKTRDKNGFRPVTIPVHRKLKRHLLDIPAKMHWGPVLPEISKLYQRGAQCVTRHIARIFKEAGIEMSIEVEGRGRRVSHASFHSIRHSFVSFAANAGAPLEVVRAIVGHETSAMTRHYYHAEEGLMRKAVAAVPTYDATGNCMFDAPVSNAKSASARLFELADTLRSGLVTQAEYETIRHEILASI